MKTIDWGSKIKEALSRTSFMALATIGSQGVWVNPVAYFYDKNLNFYWASMINSKHSKNIEENTETSIAIYKTERFPGPGDHVMGLQMKGNARVLLEINEIEDASKARSEINGDDYKVFFDEMSDPKNIWKLYKFETSEMYLFDTRDFQDERQSVDFKNIKI